MSTSFLQASSFFLLQLFSFAAFADSFYSKIERFSVKDGLPDSMIYTVIRDAKGFLWLGTPKGLARYDGKEFVTFSNNVNSTVSIASNSAENIFIDSQHRLWIGSWGNGLDLYDKSLNLINQFRHDKSNTSSLCSDKVQTFFEDNQQRIWLGTSGGGLCLYNDKFKNFSAFKYDINNKDSLSNNRVWSISQSQNGTFWVATSNGLNRFNGNELGVFSKYFHIPNDSSSISHSTVRTLLVDKHDNLWVGTERGLDRFVYDTEDFKQISVTPDNRLAPITKLSEGKNEEIWIGTQQGLLLFQPNKDSFSRFENNKFRMFPHDDIRDIYVDSDGSTWLATRRGGLIKLDYSPNLFLNHQTFLSSKGSVISFGDVNSIFEDKIGTIWLATAQGLLYLKQQESIIKRFGSGEEFYPYRINSIVEDEQHNLWLSGGFGLYSINKERTKLSDKNDVISSLKNRGIKKLIIDKNETMWIATDFHGLIKAKQSKRNYFQHNTSLVTSLSSDETNDILQDDEGNIWVATNDANLDKLNKDTEQFTHYDLNHLHKSIKMKKLVHTIFQSNSGTLWAGTPDSLYKFNKITDSFESIPLHVNLLSNNIKSINEDHNGDLWIGTSAGLSQYKVEQQYVINYKITGSKNNIDFNARSTLKTHDNRLFFGGRNGVTEIVSEAQFKKSNNGTTSITSVWVDKKRLSQYELSSDSPLIFGSSVKKITIEYTTPNLLDFDDNQFSVFLDNYDDGYSRPTQNTKITYNNLLPDQYTLFIKGLNNMGVGNQNIASMTFIILSPWWQLWWVKLLQILFVIAIITTWVKFKTYKLSQQAKLLEIKVKDRSEILLKTQKLLIDSEKNSAISSLVTGIAHEMNTPIGVSLTASSYINELVEDLLLLFNSGNISKKTFQRKLGTIKISSDLNLKNIARASDLINSFKEVSVDQLSEDTRKFNFYDYLDKIITSLRPRLLQNKIKINLNCSKTIVIDSYPGAIAQIITHLVLNSVVHGFETQEQKIITIDISQSNNSLLIKVSDNGKGIEENQLNKIFDPFYTSKRSQGNVGLGLHIVQNITTQTLGGSIICESLENQGTTFIIEFEL